VTLKPFPTIHSPSIKFTRNIYYSTPVQNYPASLMKFFEPNFKNNSPKYFEQKV
jgi:hypothetical protein